MNVRMELVYQTPKGTETTFTSEEMAAPKALLIAEDLQKTGRLDDIQFIDSHENSWNVKELKKQMEEIKAEPHHITVYFDGGYDLQTQKSGLGCAIYYEMNEKAYRLRKNASVDELESNNEAEYAACHLALQELENLEVHHLPVTITGDSLVVIKQLQGEWPCYESNLSRWADRIDHLINRMGLDPEFNIVSRKKNKEADQLASQALEGTEITSTSEVTKGK
ncbi:reverse transcriptase-like protein [Lentibacillus cibarius]|uniref:Reverse transcriptase-like protein n=1 Tax=Lentibacillus cibarius TaxID=2583219 RepID=A0A549YJE2_9BACI|nr:reverse transcriptase-like protein [Lentibacillus cibarius]TMN23196.1 reverse transcriptase-like protein [Lentibacillus cibarius]TRM11981.1 reverse transcriptase-like protein [Lentibacillus cibarius]